VSSGRSINRLGRRLHDESGVVLVVALAGLLILSIIAASVLVTAVASNGSSLKDRRGKQALGAALGGLRTATYRLNTNIPSDGACPPAAGGAPVTPDADGVCGPYSSTDAGATQPAPNSRFTYWVTTVLAVGAGSGAPDRCTGSSIAGASLPANAVKERCVTAVGEALGPGGQVTATRRVQSRMSASSSLFIIPGIWGTDFVKVGSGSSTANIVGAIGSNGMGVDQTPSTWDIDLNAKNWGDSMNPRSFGGQDYYMGGDVFFGRAGGTTPTASLIYTPTSITNPTTFPVSTVVCSTCPMGTSNNKTTISPLTALLVPNGTAGHPRDLGHRVARRDVLPLFKSPPAPVNGNKNVVPPIYGGGAMGRISNACLDAPPANTALSPCDTSRRNDNGTGISQTGCQTPVYNPGSGGATDTRTLSLRPAVNNGPPCVVSLQNGVYDFCNIDYSSNSSIAAADTSSTAEVYIFIDSNTRDVLPAAAGGSTTKACKNGISGVGNVTTPNGAGSVTSFMTNATTSLAGQLYFWGAGDSALSGNGSTATVSHNVVIPNGWQFKGIVYAPNSNIDLNPNTVLQGGLEGRSVTVENGATYVWDRGVADVDPNASRRTFYRVIFKQCAAAIPVVSGVPHPMDSC
jgi:type II secretory pathway pseudopilin PulG